MEAKYPALLFKQQLTAYVEKIYGILRDNLKKELSSLLSLCIQVCWITHTHTHISISDWDKGLNPAKGGCGCDTIFQYRFMWLNYASFDSWSSSLYFCNHSCQSLEAPLSCPLFSFVLFTLIFVFLCVLHWWSRRQEQQRVYYDLGSPLVKILLPVTGRALLIASAHSLAPWKKIL